MTDYTLYTDIDLWRLASNGDAGAEEGLIERYGRTVRVCARPYFLAGGDSEDLIQEGMLGLLSAIRRYDEASGASFKTFAETCIRNRVLEAVKAASRKKHGPLNDGVSLEYIILSEESQVGPATQPEIFRRTPEEQVLARESEKEFYSTFSRCLSVFETEVLFHFAHDVARPNNGAVFAQRDVDRVAEVDQNEGGLQKVLSVGTAARHVQKEVELCRGGQAEKGFRHGFGVSRRRVRRILAPGFS